MFLVAAYVGAAVLLPLTVGTGNFMYKVLLSADSLQPPAYSGALPAPPTPDPSKRIAVVIAGVEGAEIGDSLEAFEPLARSGAFSVYSVAPERTVLPLVPGPMAGASTLDFLPHFSFAEYDALVGRPPDIIAVPALTNYSPQHDAVVLDWIRRHFGPNTTLLGICVGVEVLADTGLAAGHTAASSTQIFDYVKSHEADARWLTNFRYYDDGAIVTSSALTTGLDATLHLVDRFVGRATALEVARQIGFTHTEVLDNPHFNPPDLTEILRVAAIAGFEGPKQQLGVLMYDGVTELGLSGIVDPMEGSLVARTLFVAPERTVIRSANGFLFVPRYGFDTLPSVDRVVVAPGVGVGVGVGVGAGVGVGVLESSSAKQQVVAAWSTHQPQRPAEDVYQNVGFGEMAYDVSFEDIARSHSGSLGRSIANELLYAGASQVNDAPGAVAEVLTALVVSVMGGAFVFAATHRGAQPRTRVRRIPQPA